MCALRPAQLRYEGHGYGRSDRWSIRCGCGVTRGSFPEGTSEASVRAWLVADHLRDMPRCPHIAILAPAGDDA